MPDGDRLDDIFGAYDVRGVVGDDLDSSVALRLGRAYADHLAPRGGGRFLVGHDVRTSSPALAEAVSVGMRLGGHSVTHLGLAATPLVYWAGAEGRFDGSVAVTASHLPPEHNGFKLCRRDAIPLSSEDGLPDILAAMRAGPPTASTLPVDDELRRAHVLDHYVARLRAHLRPARRVRVVVDAGGGAGGLDTERLLDSVADVDAFLLDAHPDGRFSGRSPNPLDVGATDRLAATVLAHGADLGVAYDGDADRAVAVDETGARLAPDALGALLAVHLLERHPGAVVLYDLRASRALAEDVAAAGGLARRTRVGHAFVKPAMRAADAVFAAELSGHYYYRDLHTTDSGLRSLIELIDLVAAADRPLSELAAPFDRYPTSGEINVAAPSAAAASEVLAALAGRFPGTAVDHLDGVSLDADDWWANVRASHTEPVLRVNVGATTDEVLHARLPEVLDAVGAS